MRNKNPEDKVCPYCGYNEEVLQPEPFLPVRTELNGRYVVGKVLSSNGEGITYLGWDKASDTPVRIREYFPDGMASRKDGILSVSSEYDYSFNEGLVQFLDLARGLARMRELPAIISVYDIFEENGTAYYVAENIDGITYREFLLRNGGTISWKQIAPMLMPVLNTLSSLHAVGIIHRGISPETMMVGRDGRIRLIGFCIEPVRTARTDFSAQLFPGYAAIEQYGFDDQQGTWTDVYAFAACIYRTIVGNPPPEATARVTDDNMTVPASVVSITLSGVISALADALQILPEDRIQTAEAFKEELSFSRGTASSGTAEFSKKSVTGKIASKQKQKKKKKSSMKYWLIGLLTTILLLAVIAAILIPVILPDEEPQPPVSSVPSAPSVIIPSNTTPSVPDDSVVSVPNFVGQAYSALVNNVEYKDIFDFVISETKQYSDEYAKGTVISQTPNNGESVQKGSTITLVISLGSAKVEIPNVIGMGKEQAELELYKAGFSNITLLEINDSAQAPASIVAVEALEQTVSYTVGDAVYADLPIFLTYNTYEPPESNVSSQGGLTSGMNGTGGTGSSNSLGGTSSAPTSASSR